MTGPSDSTRTDAGTITVMVTFFADLRRFLPRGADGPQRYTVPGGATIDDLLAMIGIAPDAEVVAREASLHEGAEVMLLSPMEGGAAGEATTSMEGRAKLGDAMDRYGY